MKRGFGVLLAVCAAMAIAKAASEVRSPLRKEAGAGAVSGVPPSGPGVILYDQFNSASGNGAPDQDFEAALDSYDSEGADDFVVTDTAWSVVGVNTIGIQSSGGTATSVDVTFYDNAAGGGNPDLPGTVECSYAGVIPLEAAGSFTIILPAPCLLPMGTHWVAIQTNQPFGGGNGQHFWGNRTVQSGSESVWRNPGDGFASGCTSFAPQTSCGVGGGTSPDFLFQIVGDVVPVELESFEATE
ncbi:MAG TPA: hypothetical protein VGB99_15365 [Acidobacteriota bacterium]